MVETISKLEDFDNAVLVKRDDGKYFVVSSIEFAFDTGAPETLAFSSDSKGNITSWTDVAGGRYATREETIAQLDFQQGGSYRAIWRAM